MRKGKEAPFILMTIGECTTNNESVKLYKNKYNLCILKINIITKY